MRLVQGGGGKVVVKVWKYPEMMNSTNSWNLYSCMHKWNKYQCFTFILVITLRRLYFATAEVRFMFSSSFRKLGLAFNLEYLCQFFINFNNQCQFWNPHDEQITNLSLIFKFNEEITEKIGNEKDETKLIFEKYQLSLTSNISAKISSNWACRGCFGIVTTSRF